ncbi:MAG: apolipoprotein N-acyltransferase [Chlorobi bacterium]|nr:apolipoprotein N-acyltransferase [Chlorobiota bacterium]
MKRFFGKYRDVLTPERKKTRRAERILAVASGIFMGAAFPPLPFYYFIFVGLIPYLSVIERKKGLGEINRTTYLFAFVFNLITLYWVGSWTPNADKFLMVSGVALLFFNPILFLIPSTLYYFTKKLFNARIALYLLPFFWASYEYAYTVTEFRFPWLTLGNGLPYANSFIQIADIVGVYGLTFFIIIINVFLYLGVKRYLKEKRPDFKYVLIAFLIFLFPLIYGHYKLRNFKPSGRMLKVGLIQPDFDPTNKWSAGSVDEQLQIYLRLSEKTIREGAKLVVWPETALPVYLLSPGNERTLRKIRKFCDSANVFIMTGIPDVVFYPDSAAAPSDAKRTKSGKSFYTSYNSVILFSPTETEIQKYHKIMLVPFGERVPLVDVLPFLGDLIKWEVGLSGWNVGKEQNDFYLRGISPNGLSAVKDTVNAAGIICIESIYPDFVSTFVKEGAEFIAVVTNDSWYGDSSGPYQHKGMSVIRAVENRRSVIRAANGGISCLINPLGLTVKETKMFEQTAITVNVPLRKKLTFYTKHPVLIPIICSVVSLWIIGLFFLTKLKIKLKV